MTRGQHQIYPFPGSALFLRWKKGWYTYTYRVRGHSAVARLLLEHLYALLLRVSAFPVVNLDAPSSQVLYEGI